MFRVLTCPSSGGKIVFTQHLILSLSVNSCRVQRMRTDCSAVCSYPAYCTVLYTEWRYQMLCEYNLSSWRWACQYSKHVEDISVTYILLMNKELCIKVGWWNNSILWRAVGKTSNYVKCVLNWLILHNYPARSAHLLRHISQFNGLWSFNISRIRDPG